MAPVITSMEELRAFAAQFDTREALTAAATGPAEQATTVSARRLAAEAPTLAPLKMKKLTDRELNGKRVEELLEAGKKANALGKTAVLAHTPLGVRIIDDLDAVTEDSEVVPMATYREVRRDITVHGKTPREVALDILARELKAVEKAAA